MLPLIAPVMRAFHYANGYIEAVLSGIEHKKVGGILQWQKLQ